VLVIIDVALAIKWGRFFYIVDISIREESSATSKNRPKTLEEALSGMRERVLALYIAATVLYFVS